MKICHAIFQTKFGSAAAVYTYYPFQLIKIYLPRQHLDILMNDLSTDYEITDGYHPDIDILIENMNLYFTGHPIQTPWSWLKWDSMTPLQIRTLKQTAQIPYGAVCSYKNLAQKVGHPKAARFVGSCMAKNPYPIIIPCHRVIKADGSIGQFGGGAALKKRLLALEKERVL